MNNSSQIWRNSACQKIILACDKTKQLHQLHLFTSSPLGLRGAVLLMSAAASTPSDWTHESERNWNCILSLCMISV